MQPRTEPPPYTDGGRPDPPHRSRSSTSIRRSRCCSATRLSCACSASSSTSRSRPPPAWRRPYRFRSPRRGGQSSPTPSTSPLFRPNTTNVMPVTMTTSSSWLAEPSTISPEIAEGLLRLSDPGAYQVIEVDLDGTSVKALNFVQNVWNAQFPMRSADTPTHLRRPRLCARPGFRFPRSGRPPPLPELVEQRLVQLALSSTPRGRSPCTPKTSPRVGASTSTTPPGEVGTRCAPGRRRPTRRGWAATASAARQRSSRCPPGTRAGSSRPRPSRRRALGHPTDVPARDA